MAERIQFNKRSIEALKPPESGRRCVYDAATPNLIVIVTEAGSKTFYRYGKVKGKPERILIGRFPDVTVEQARKTCKDISGKLARGEKPDQTQRRGGLTLRQLFDLYLDRYARAHKRTWKQDVYQFEKYLGELAGCKIADIEKSDIETFHVRVGETIGKVTANRAWALLSKLFSFAIQSKLVKDNPCKGITKFAEVPRDRFLQPEEMPRIFAELDAHPNQTFADFIRLSLYIGARRGNMLSMRWEEISLARREWRIPRTKAGPPLIVALPVAAVEILERRQRDANGSPWVFPSKSASGHLESPRKTWVKLLQRAGVAGVTIHDLRRTFGSWQAAAGASGYIVGRSLGHSSGSRVTSVYARLNLDPVRQSIEAATAAMLAAAKMEGNGNVATDA